MRAVWIGALVLALAGCQGSGEKKITLENQKDKVSYSIGLNIGANMQKDSIAINPEAFLRGVKDAMADSGKRLMSEQEVKQTMMAFQQEMTNKRLERSKVAAENNLKEGQAFLAENKNKPGVIVLPSGLQYQVLREGSGAIPKGNQTVTAHYRGTLLDGKEFDSSYKHGQPMDIPVKGVFPGWSEALQLMKVGSKWKLFIPSNLAYGEQGAGDVIGPNSALIFEVELLGVK